MTDIKVDCEYLWLRSKLEKIRTHKTLNPFQPYFGVVIAIDETFGWAQLLVLGYSVYIAKLSSLYEIPAHED